MNSAKGQEVPRDKRGRRRRGGQPKHPRTRALHAANSDVGELARLADVSYRFAMMWCAEQWESEALERAFQKLTGKPAA
jgi:hypothetical protein